MGYKTRPGKKTGPETPKRPARAPVKGKTRPVRRSAPKKGPAPERLQKIISRAGITSRRKAEEMILQGRVTVNRATITELGAKADPVNDIIEVDGKALSFKGPLLYFLLNKPKGVISSVTDPLQRPVVVDLVKVPGARLLPVGRLDYDAEGALILTNDGELLNILIHPTYSVPKKYLVKVSDVPDETDLARLEAGVRLEDGRTRPAKARFIKKTSENSWIELTVYEGRNRLVKRMCQAVGHPVLKLKRVEFAGLKLGGLEPGQARPLTPAEVEKLKAWALEKPKDAKPQKQGSKA